MGKAAHHRGPHQMTARRLTRAWFANPATVCGFCGLTYTEGVNRYGRRRARWVADHFPPGNLEGRYRPAHHTCNSSAGAKDRNRRQKGTGYDWP